MPYLVDGHNLIPRLPGLSLSDPEDERALIGLLEQFAKLRRTRVEVYFDQAPPSRAGSQTFGRLKAHFIRRGTTADQAIINRLQSLGKSAQNWTTVTSDREIQAEARALHSQIRSAPEFAKILREVLSEDRGKSPNGEDPPVSQSEVDYWLDQFTQG